MERAESSGWEMMRGERQAGHLFGAGPGPGVKILRQARQRLGMGRVYQGARGPKTPQMPARGHFYKVLICMGFGIFVNRILMRTRGGGNLSFGYVVRWDLVPRVIWEVTVSC
jgi:hypothetical protein